MAYDESKIMIGHALSSLKLLRRVFSTPPEVLVFKLRQRVRLVAMRRFCRWESVALLAAQIAARHHTFATGWAISADGFAAARRMVSENETLRGAVLAEAERISARDFQIFKAAVPSPQSWVWNADWRMGKVWPNKPFETYNHYETREEPYDVKFPWELSRFSWLVPLLQAAVLFERREYLRDVIAVLRDWRAHNPLAGSINWVPMEASMRAINLFVLLELSAFLPSAMADERRALQTQLVEALIGHGVFVWQTREFAADRGNHYAANVVALLVCGAALHDVYAPAKEWFAFAVAEIPREIGKQFSPDGVNFEKSVSYHRLVTELFLLAAIVLGRFGEPLPQAASERLRRACCYAFSCRRPDGLSVNAGDSDDAALIVFEPCDVRDHRALIDLGGGILGPAKLAGAIAGGTLGRAWLAADAPPLSADAARTDKPGAEYFADGGIVVVHSDIHHIWIDVGDVGQNGLGGHGHNDLFSFELCLDGQALIVDPGTYLYTGDLGARAWFRSTAAHNGASVDDEEIAPLLGHWRIGNNARPRDVQVTETGETVRISAAHGGYERLFDPVTHRREFSVELPEFRVRVEDYFRCAAAHRIVRRLHLAVGAQVSQTDNEVEIRLGGRLYRISANSDCAISVENSWVSNYFGQREQAAVVVLTDVIGPDARLNFVVERKASSL